MQMPEELGQYGYSSASGNVQVAPVPQSYALAKVTVRLTPVPFTYVIVQHIAQTSITLNKYPWYNCLLAPPIMQHMLCRSNNA